MIGDRCRLGYAAARLVLGLGGGRAAHGERDDADDTNRPHNRHWTREDAIVVRLSREKMRFRTFVLAGALAEDRTTGGGG